MTITGGLFRGFTREAAARFSFLLALPSISGAGFYSLYADWDAVTRSSDQVVDLVVATLVSFVVGYLSIAFLLGFLRRYSTGVFIAYRIGLGLLIFALLATGHLKDVPTAEP